MRVLLSMLPLIAGCGSGEPDAPPCSCAPVATAIADATPPPPPPPPTPPPPELNHVTQSAYYAVFVGDELDQCIELTRRYEIPASTEWAPRELPPLTPIPEGRVIALTVDCDTSFAGRTILASCEGTADLAARSASDPQLASVPPGVTMLETLSTKNYRFATALASDTRLMDCLAAQHLWTAVPEASIEYVRARAHREPRSMRSR